MNIKVTGYAESTLFNFDMIVNNNSDFEKVIRVLRVFYDNSQDGFVCKDKAVVNPLNTLEPIIAKHPDNHSEIKDLMDKDYVSSQKWDKITHSGGLKK